MTQDSRRYAASSLAAQQPRVEPLTAPSVNWREIRRWILPVSALVAAVALYLLQSSYATTTELDIARMAAERDTIQHHNAQLSAEIADLEKPSRIHDRAVALGMVAVSKTVRVNVPPAAEVPAVAAPTPTGAAAPSLWQQLIDDIALRIAGTGQ